MLTFKIFEPYINEIVHGVTTIDETSFNDTETEFEENLANLMQAQNIARPVFAKQIHTDVILDLKEAPESRPEADAFMTKAEGLPLMVKVADCQGVLIYDPKVKAIAAVHSGWRGSAVNIIGKTLQKMQDTYGCKAEDILIGISPSIGPCCSEFSDPENELPDFCQPYTSDEHVDFWKLTMKQCKDAGLPEENVEFSGICTSCNPLYFSYRKGDNGRMAVFISLKKS